MPNEQVPGAQTETRVVSTGYSPEYVKELRDEAASWRNKLRDKETEYTTLQESIKQTAIKVSITDELQKRSLKVNPDWIKIGQGKSAKDAVDDFLKEYPQWEGGTETQEEIVTQTQVTDPRTTQRAQTVKKTNTNVQTNQVRELDQIKNDPIARSKLRDKYRALLNNQKV